MTKLYLENLQSEIEWWRTYGEFIAVNYSHANAESIEYTDKEQEKI
tara:strand:- start:321 stop:458 length:138 start_codon:yes stop_codon:yes gene_type:complete